MKYDRDKAHPQPVSLELLAPAKNLACGLAAIEHGADAVYIGAPRFGARAQAGNSIDDIAELCRFAHQYAAKVYVTLNTIVYDDELEAVGDLVCLLTRAGVDALLIQDMGIYELIRQMGQSEPVPALHASTQTDNRTADKVAWLRDLGFKRVVLARELSVDEIQSIHEAVPDVELEVFVHGALCVSYSGLCYASQYCFGRSANRGECAQFCRLKFNLEDADGHVIEQGRYLLSLKDMCQIDHLEELVAAGAVSFKIEGRLKDVAYVKNVTAAYSQRLDQLCRRHPNRYKRASHGSVGYSFKPNLQKTFNRGFTQYFLKGRQPDIFSPDTPKAIGEYVGRVKELRGASLTVAGTAVFANGDGLCFLNSRRELEGFRINKAENNRLFPYKMPAGLTPGTALYRNNNMAFERLMAGNTAQRKAEITMTLSETPTGFRLQSGMAAVEVETEKQMAQKPQAENIVRQLTKLGNTPFTCSEVRMVPEPFGFFIPSSFLSDLRRRLVEKLTGEDCASGSSLPVFSEEKTLFRPQKEYVSHPYLWNVANRLSQHFYEERGVSPLWPAFEVCRPAGQQLLMQCRHCLKFSLGYCPRHGRQPMPWREPLCLVLPDGRRFPLVFDCSQCQMNVYSCHEKP